jgi:phage N-6-adenine-methyltransferase
VNTDLMFSTGKDDWATPPEVFDPLNAEFGFTLDAAANSRNHRCSEWFGPDHPDNSRRNALYSGLSWGDGSVWINPPYSRGLQGKFIERAALAGANFQRVVMLLPARTDTRAFHDHIWDRKQHKPHSWVREVRFLKGRVRFVGAPASAPFPSMIVVFGS